MFATREITERGNDIEKQIYQSKRGGGGTASVGPVCLQDHQNAEWWAESSGLYDDIGAC